MKMSVANLIKAVRRKPMTSDKWVYSFNEECFMCSPYDSKEDAIADGLEEAKEMEENGVYVGRVVPLKMSDLAPDGGSVIERCMDCAYDRVGENADAWIEGILTKDVKKLTKQLKLLLDKWADANDYQPTFFAVENVEWHSIGD